MFGKHFNAPGTDQSANVKVCCTCQKQYAWIKVQNLHNPKFQKCKFSNLQYAYEILEISS